MKDQIEKLKEEITARLANVNSEEELNLLKPEYLGKNGKVTELSSKIKDVPNEERKSFGILLNDIKTFANDGFSIKQKELEEKKLNEKLEKEAIDVTLPGTTIKNGSPNIFYPHRRGPGKHIPLPPLLHRRRLSRDFLPRLALYFK